MDKIHSKRPSLSKKINITIDDCNSFFTSFFNKVGIDKKNLKNDLLKDKDCAKIWVSVIAIASSGIDDKLTISEISKKFIKISSYTEKILTEMREIIEEPDSTIHTGIMNSDELFAKEFGESSIHPMHRLEFLKKELSFLLKFSSIMQSVIETNQKESKNYYEKILIESLASLYEYKSGNNVTSDSVKTEHNANYEGLSRNKKHIFTYFLRVFKEFLTEKKTGINFPSSKTIKEYLK